MAAPSALLFFGIGLRYLWFALLGFESGSLEDQPIFVTPVTSYLRLQETSFLYDLLSARGEDEKGDAAGGEGRGGRAGAPGGDLAASPAGAVAGGAPTADRSTAKKRSWQAALRSIYRPFQNLNYLPPLLFLALRPVCALAKTEGDTVFWCFLCFVDVLIFGVLRQLARGRRNAQRAAFSADFAPWDAVGLVYFLNPWVMGAHNSLSHQNLHVLLVLTTVLAAYEGKNFLTAVGYAVTLYVVPWTSVVFFVPLAALLASRGGRLNDSSGNQKKESVPAAADCEETAFATSTWEDVCRAAQIRYAGEEQEIIARAGGKKDGRTSRAEGTSVENQSKVERDMLRRLHGPFFRTATHFFAQTVAVLLLLLYASFLVTDRSWNFLHSSCVAILKVEDLSPTLSVFWYLFQEIFPRFTTLFLLIFNTHVLVYILPLHLFLNLDYEHSRFGPLANCVAAFGLLTLFRPYPTVVDFSALVALYSLFADEVLPRPEGLERVDPATGETVVYEKKVRVFLVTDGIKEADAERRDANAGSVREKQEIAFELVPPKVQGRVPGGLTDADCDVDIDFELPEETEEVGGEEEDAGDGNGQVGRVVKRIKQRIRKCSKRGRMKTAAAPSFTPQNRLVLQLTFAFFGIAMFPVMTEVWLTRNTGNANFLFFMHLLYLVSTSLTLMEFVGLTHVAQRTVIMQE
eukprot:g3392.t1